jgi:hypothetical protein
MHRPERKGGGWLSILTTLLVFETTDHSPQYLASREEKAVGTGPNTRHHRWPTVIPRNEGQDIWEILCSLQNEGAGGRWTETTWMRYQTLRLPLDIPF